MYFSLFNIQDRTGCDEENERTKMKISRIIYICTYNLKFVINQC